MLGTKLPPWPSFSQDEIERVSEVLRSNKVNYWTGGEARAFEKEFAEYYGTRYAIALANGSVAIELALLSLGIGRGDEVIVTPRTFIASISSIINVGAKPVFADVEKDSGNISARTIEAVLSPATKAVICVHLAGWPCDMEGIMALAEQNNFYVIEDCAQSHGSSYKGQKLGSIGHISAFSFCQDKIMTTGGEGGMMLCNDEKIWSKAWSYKDHGKSWSAVYEMNHSDGYRWLHESFGTNWRLTEMQAAIGRYQLKKLDEWSLKRKQNAERYNVAAQGCSAVYIPEVPDYIDYVPYKHYIYVQPEALKSGWSRDRIILELNNKDVPCLSGTCSEVYLEKAFEGTGLRPQERLPMAAQLGDTSMCLLVHPNITDADMDRVCSVFRSVLIQAGI
ncbi:DegT/DnrJ/EryC1/StrS aminotransferase family protein [Paraneptunicella aestuarii]|uniref:DegT/DnrJ/EryC1/StrS family aminotransferase n=1 Tax=Paraneptunicella aestuarii TaxID=2831148 RepID=UPI001E4609B3|nr:DegT/DnrJ/EryC1/StrS aminotransferase family protein [Paraneptunicella aestuarii]UAA39666.1 DegT/DnrJ/EryC1/StrS aminotransferase family protein [Paraneptunicella aestuarii]